MTEACSVLRRYFGLQAPFLKNISCQCINQKKATFTYAASISCARSGKIKYLFLTEFEGRTASNALRFLQFMVLRIRAIN